MRVGVVGCGSIARKAHLPALTAAGARISAVAGRRLETAEALAAECGATPVSSWQELVVRDDVDAVLIATPNTLHCEQAAAALTAGKHVLVEKPMTATTAESDALLALGSRHPYLVLMPAHNARFAPLVVAAAERAREVGVRSLRLALRNSGPLVWSPGSDWFVDPARSGGGALLDLGVHLFDVARFVLGDELEVVAAEVNHDGGIDVDAAVSLRSTRGVAVQVEVSWRSPAPGFELSLADDAGVVECRPNLGVPADTVQAAFVRAVTSGASYSPTAADGRAAVALAHDAYAAAR